MVRDSQSSLSLNLWSICRLRGSFVAKQIVDSPPTIELPGPPAIGPPRVRPIYITGVLADEIPPTRVDQSIHPGTFVRKKSACVLIRLPMKDVTFIPGDVEVAADDDGAAPTLERLHPRCERIHKMVFPR